MRYYTIDDVQRDWRCLDAEDFAMPEGVRLISHEEFTYRPGFPKVQHIRPRGIAAIFAKVPFLGRILFALQMLLFADSRTTIICLGGEWFEKYLGLLNYYLPFRRRKLLLVGPFIQTDSPLKRKYARRMVEGSTLSVTWSAFSKIRMANYLHIDKDKIIHVPYKSNHSKSNPIKLSIGNYLFSGGNGCRDYRTLIEAVRGTSIPTIISTTDPKTVQGLDIPENVIILAAKEPAFARLMAASRLVVFPIRKEAVRGGAAANILNAMWHYKPVIAAEEVQAPEYIEEGRTGYYVPAGDVSRLRECILMVWNAPPEFLSEMGRHAHDVVAEHYSHELFIRRVCRLATIVAAT